MAHESLSRIHVADDSLARRMLAHWQQIIGAMPTENEPFQHVFVEGFWPDDVYAQMLKMMPPEDLYRPLNIKRWVNAQGVSTRDKCYPSETIERMSGEPAEFWRQVVLALTSRGFKELMFLKFREDVALRLKCRPEDVNQQEMYVGISLTRDSEGYRIKPHPDGYPRVVTAQFYLPADDTQRDLGTSFYEKNGLLGLLSGKRFREIKRMPFLPNTGYAFAVNDCKERHSYHGREVIESGSGVRQSILMEWISESATEKRAAMWPVHHDF